MKKLLFFALWIMTCSSLFAVEAFIIENPYQPDKNIEFFVKKPERAGSYPVIFLLHGYQPEENSSGGRQLVDYGYLDRFVEEGIVAVSISIPGFGRSNGERDFSGPESQKAVASVIEYVASLGCADPTRMGIYGISRGATLASLVPIYYPELTVLILESGEYDVTNRRALLPEYLSGMRDNLLQEVGADDEDYIARSALYNTSSIQSTTLLLHGEFDDRRGLPSAVALQAQLLQEGKECLLKIYPNEGHALFQEKWDAIIPFVRQQFFNKYGIGIKITPPTPALQICKIHADSSASKSGRLKVGDAILTISPNDDEEEIDVLGMPVKQVIRYLLGEKGSRVRLQVQHFDLTYENVLLERG